VRYRRTDGYRSDTDAPLTLAPTLEGILRSLGSATGQPPPSLTEWAGLVGDDLARVTMPVGWHRGQLVVRVGSAVAASRLGFVWPSSSLAARGVQLEVTVVGDLAKRQPQRQQRSC
jgi:hypothetical protein